MRSFLEKISIGAFVLSLAPFSYSLYNSVQGQKHMLTQDQAVTDTFRYEYNLDRVRNAQRELESKFCYTASDIATLCPVILETNQELERYASGLEKEINRIRSEKPSVSAYFEKRDNLKSQEFYGSAFGVGLLGIGMTTLALHRRKSRLEFEREREEKQRLWKEKLEK